MKNIKKKGFTLVELLVVIAIIAILATVSIVGYTAFINKANLSNDTSLVKQMNTALQASEVADGKKNTNAYDAVQDILEAGFDLAKLTPTANGFNIVWDETTDRVALLADDGSVEFSEATVSADKTKLWITSAEVSTTYSTYFTGTDLTTDLAANICIGTKAGDILTINAPNANVAHYGEAAVMNIKAVASASYYEFGRTDKITVEKGHVAVQSTGSVGTLFVPATADGVKLDGNFGVVLTQKGSQNVAFGDNYKSTAEMKDMEAADGSDGFYIMPDDNTIMLIKDWTVPATYTVNAGATLTIDLNGFDMSSEVANDGKAAAVINNKGTLTIKGQGSINFVALDPDLQEIPSYATNTITNTGNLTIEAGVTVVNDSDGGASYCVDNHGTFTMNGGTLKANRCALRIAKYNVATVVCNINGGVIEGKTPVWIQLPGSDASVAPSITVTINGGKFITTKASSADNNIFYTYSHGNSHANTSITINGGEFIGGVVSIGSGYKGDAPTLTIKGGTFEYDVMQWLENDASKVVFSKNK